MTRENTSRPYWSDPKMYGSPGLYSWWTGSMRIGSKGAMSGASTATSTMPTSMTSPPTAPRLRARRRPSSKRRAGGRAVRSIRTGALTAVEAMIPSGVSNARVEDAVQQVDQQIHQDVRDRDHQDHALHDGQIF